jgi:predicted O-methyltransferase YrrM
VSERDNLYLTETLREMDNLPCSHPASVNVDVANYYYSLTKMLRPLLIVEIGCFIGFSTGHFAQALKDLGFGRIISIDPFDWDVDAGKGTQNRQEVAEHYRKKGGFEEIITYVKGYSTEVYSELADQIRNRIDLLYIDGDHSVRGVFADFRTYFGDVRVGGHVILHDIYPSMCGVDGPRMLIDRLKKTRAVPRQIELIEMHTRDGFGIALLRKLSRNPVSLSYPLGYLAKKGVRKIMGKAGHRTGEDRYEVVITITDVSTGRPIPGALFVCPQRWGEYRVAGADGRICLDHYLPNRYLVDVSAEGYTPRNGILLDITADAPHQEFAVALDPKGSG